MTWQGRLVFVIHTSLKKKKNKKKYFCEFKRGLIASGPLLRVCWHKQKISYFSLSIYLYIALYIVGHNKGGSAPYYLSWSLFPLPHWSASAAATAGWLEPRANPGARVSSDSFKLFDIFSPLLYWWRYTRTTKSTITTLNKGGREKREGGPPEKCVYL